MPLGGRSRGVAGENAPASYQLQASKSCLLEGGLQGCWKWHQAGDRVLSYICPLLAVGNLWQPVTPRASDVESRSCNIRRCLPP